MRRLADSSVNHMYLTTRPNAVGPNVPPHRRKTCFEAVRSGGHDPWMGLAGQPQCPLLPSLSVAHLGTMRIAAPFAFSRCEQPGTILLSCLAGTGSVLVDGVRFRLAAGDACIIPRGAVASLRCHESEVWECSWVRFTEILERLQGLPVCSAFPPDGIRSAIAGLRTEVIANGSGAAVRLWLELIVGYFSQLLRLSRSDERLCRVWDEVNGDLDRPWTLTEMATIACVSEEHLRRICQRELGRSPMQQVAHIRMNKACHLLAKTDEKIATIAREVGYKNPFAFSTAFKKWIGFRPSSYRTGSPSSTGAPSAELPVARTG